MSDLVRGKTGDWEVVIGDDQAQGAMVGLRRQEAAWASLSSAAAHEINQVGAHEVDTCVRVINVSKGTGHIFFHWASRN